MPPVYWRFFEGKIVPHFRYRRGQFEFALNSAGINFAPLQKRAYMVCCRQRKLSWEDANQTAVLLMRLYAASKQLSRSSIVRALRPSQQAAYIVAWLGNAGISPIGS